jgi:photosystem II stability/assembly factor-like uncharacterized protein
MRTRTHGRFAGRPKTWRLLAALLVFMLVFAVAPVQALAAEIVWTKQNSGMTTLQTLLDVHFIDANTGWVVGYGGTILKTTNGGVTWTPQVSGTTAKLNAVDFYDANHGWVVGDGGIIRATTNGGVTWTGQTPGGVNIAGVEFVSPDSGWVVGDGGLILHTTNGGTNWLTQASGITADLTAVDFVSTSAGWVVGSGGVILHTANGGGAWTSRDSGTGSTLNAVHFFDASRGWAVGNAAVICQTTNGGATWTPQTVASIGDEQLYAVDFVDANTGWAVGHIGTMIKTTNGGTTWTSQDHVMGGSYHGIDMLDATTGWIVGGASYILKSQLPAQSAITIKTTATKAVHGSAPILSGAVTPFGMIGRNIVVWVKKPGKSFYSYSSNRTAYQLGGGAAWYYKYTFKNGMKTGVYYFRASAPAPGFETSIGYLPSTTGVISIRLR